MTDIDNKPFGDFTLGMCKDLYNVVVNPTTPEHEASFVVNWLKGTIKIPRQVQIMIYSQIKEELEAGIGRADPLKAAQKLNEASKQALVEHGLTPTDNPSETAYE